MCIRDRTCTKLEKAIYELEQLDIDSELDDHEKLSEWTDLNKHHTNLTKELATVERALEQADKNVQKIGGDLDNLEHAKCYACGQELHDEKLESLRDKVQRDYGDAHTYMIEISEKQEKVQKKLNEIGDLSRKPNTFYETAKEAYEHRGNVENLKKALQEKEEETDPYQEQIDDLKDTALQEVNWDTINELKSTKNIKTSYINY